MDRTRNRWSFIISHESATGHIDLTRSISNDKTRNIGYSIEIEIDSNTIGQKITKDQMDLIDKWLRVLVSIINRTGILMSTQEHNNIKIEFNRALRINRDYINSRLLNKPKDLEKRDLSLLEPTESRLFMQLADYDLSSRLKSKQLKSNKIFRPLFTIPGGYSVSLKADGVRYLIFFGFNGVYLINPTDPTANIITKIIGKGTKYPHNPDMIPGTIIDGEIISKIDGAGLSKGTYDILAFDILAYKGVDVRGIPRKGIKETSHISYHERLKILDTTIAELFKLKKFDPSADLKLDTSNLLNVVRKEVQKLPSIEDVDPNRPFETSIQFFKIMEQIIIQSRQTQKTGGIEWGTDGMIFTPSERPYNEKEIDKRRKEETDIFSQLTSDEDTNQSLVRKWKEEITIDYQVRKTSVGILTIMSYSNQFRMMVPFNGTRNPGRFEWNGNVELKPPFTPTPRKPLLTVQNMEEGIFEFRWGYSNQFLAMAFIPIRERTDKPSANSAYVAAVDWNLINSPITANDLMGRTLTFMRKYHNKVKSALLTELASRLRNPILLDIGSGRGGDISKWTPFNRVYAVEPDVKNLRSFISRLERRQDVEDKVISETEKIEGNLMSHYSRAKSIRSRSVVRRKEGPRQGQHVTNIVPINVPAQDIETLLQHIPIGKVNCVTMFNVLTFFYNSLKSIEDLIRTVRTLLIPGGYFYLIALDGELLLNSMQGHNTISTLNISISKSPDPSCRKIFIKIKGTIVRGQFEYLVQPREFVQLMDRYGFRLIDERYLTEESLMSNEEYWFSSMSKVMKFRFFSGPIKIEIRNFSKSLIETMKGQKVIRPLDPGENPSFVKSTSFGIKGIVRFGAPQDGSCYLHAALRAFSKAYKALTISERHGAILQLRADLAKRYTQDIHNAIGDGFFESSGLPAYKYEQVKANIADGRFWIHNGFKSFLSRFRLRTIAYHFISANPSRNICYDSWDG